MLQFFRNFFKSKLGLGITLVFLVLIAFAFTSGDVASNSAFGGVAGGDQVAVVGEQKISASDLSTALTNALNNERQQNPTATMESFLAGGGLDRVLKQLLQRTALAEYARQHNLRAGDRLVDSELVQIQAFRGADGKFSRELFLNTLRQQGLSEATVRQDIAAGLYAQQVLIPASYGTAVPQSLAAQYAVLLREQRKGSIAVLPSAAFAPKGDPTAAQLKTYYDANRTAYLRPERRVIRYAAFGEEAVGDIPAPTDAQIAARYNRDKGQYAARESPSFTQMVVPTEAAAKVVMAEISGGTSLAAAASSKGLATTTIGPLSKAELASQASQAVAEAAFAAGQGAIATPTRGGLGWFVLRVDKIDRVAGKSLADVRGAIAETLTQELRRAAFLDLAARIEDELDGGASLGDIAAELKVKLEATAPITADGRVYASSDTAPAVLKPVLRTAFEMEESEPQLAEVEPNKTFVVYGVSDITPSAAAPLADIRADAIADWRRSEGAKAAKAAADRVLKRVEGGQSIAAAIAAEKVALPAPDKIDMGREDLAQQQRVPPVLALMFSMAKGTVKRLEGPGKNGWFVVQLDDVVVPEVDKDDPFIAATQRQLASVAGDEYSEQMVAAAMREVGVEKNQTAIDAVVRQLTGRTE